MPPNDDHDPRSGRTDRSSAPPSRRDFLRNLGKAAIGGAALSAMASTAAEAAGTCDPPLGSIAKGTGSYAVPAAFNKVSYGLRTRKSVTKLNAAELARYQLAYEKLRALPATDPRAWMSQANVHCFYCSGAPSVQVHGSWKFFAWHRAYLHYHERILAKLVGDPTFALPYWDWATDRSIPVPYRDVKSSLYNAKRGAARNDGTGKIGDDLVGPAVLGKVLDGVSTAGFVGDAGSGGNLEFGAHGGVHMWVNGEMGSLSTAARDPIFYAHHNNIDRLWAVWLAKGGGRANPPDAAFLNTTWKFADENGAWCTIKAKDVLDPKGSLACTWNHDPGVPPEGYLVASAPAGAPPGADESVSLAANAALPGKPHTYKSKLTSQNKKMLEDTQNHAYFLRIDGMEVPPNEGALLRVFVNQPDADHRTPVSHPSCVGYVAIVPKVPAGEGGHSHHADNVALRIPHEARKHIARTEDMQVTFVPVDAEGHKVDKVSFRHKRVHAVHHRRNKHA